MTILDFNCNRINMNRLMQDILDQGGRLELVVGKDNYQHLDLIKAQPVQEAENA